MKDKARGILFIGNFFKKKVYTASLMEDFSFQIKNLGYKVYTVSKRRNRFLKVIDMLYSIIKLKGKYGLAIVDVFSAKAFLWAEMSAMLLKFLNKPFILNLRGGGLPEFARGKEGRVERLLKGASLVTSPSGFLKDEMKKFREDIIVIPNGIDISNYPFKLRNEAKPKIIWFRAFHKVYNPEMALKVFEKVKEFYPEAKLCMVGPDKKDGSLEKIKKIIFEKEFDKYIKLIEGIPKSEVPRVLSDYDIFLNTSNIDNTPVSVIEALACGLCVVSTEAGGMPFLLKDREEGILVPVGSSDDMAQAVIGVLKDKDLCAKLSSKGRKKAETFDWKNILPLWIENFKNYINE